VEKCKRLGRAMRIGTNHGSLSARILSFYGDTPRGMVCTLNPAPAPALLFSARSVPLSARILSLYGDTPRGMVRFHGFAHTHYS
jgi:4-hydroxy-3-methylbut-2-en-1-yl diphosphate synthase IspG/GcpE